MDVISEWIYWHFMKHDLRFAEEYFKDDSNNEGMMMLWIYGTQKRRLENSKEKKKEWLCKRNIVHETIRKNENI